MYHIAYDPERWEHGQQYVLCNLDDDRRLIAHLYLTDGGQVVVARAWIEQAYVTRRDGWKWRTVEQLRPEAVHFAPLLPTICNLSSACTLIP
jgi:hypothetical protein